MPQTKVPTLPVIKRVQKYYDVLLKQDDFIEQFLQAKSEKKTVQETCYLQLMQVSQFEDVYVSVSGSRKVIFTIPAIIDVVKAYDQAESELAQSLSDGGGEDDFFRFFEGFVSHFEEVIKQVFYTIIDRPDPYGERYYAGNFVAEEVRKFLGIVIDSQTKSGQYFLFTMIESLALHRRKIAFKAYEKCFKVMCKKETIDAELFHRFAISYGKIYPKLRRSYRHKMLKLLGSQLSKVVGDQQNIKIFEGIFAF